MSKISAAQRKIVKARIRKLQKDARDPKLSRGGFESIMGELAKREAELKRTGGGSKKKRRGGSKSRGGKKRKR